MRMNNTIQQDRYICKRRMISEIIGDKHKMKRKHLSLFSGFHRGYTETVWPAYNQRVLHPVNARQRRR